jgi:hypothetical protein
VAISTELIRNASQRDELVVISQSRSLPAGYVFRAKLILMLAEGASERAFPLHADVFVVAESSRDLVFQGRARRDCSRNLYQREGSGPPHPQ